MTCTTSIDAMFKRKRGRPPKNRVIEVGALLRSFVSQRPATDKNIIFISCFSFPESNSRLFFILSPVLSVKIDHQNVFAPFLCTLFLIPEKNL
jgi:hypothetical protein